MMVAAGIVGGGVLFCGVGDVEICGGGRVVLPLLFETPLLGGAEEQDNWSALQEEQNMGVSQWGNCNSWIGVNGVKLEVLCQGDLCALCLQVSFEM